MITWQKKLRSLSFSGVCSHYKLPRKLHEKKKNPALGLDFSEADFRRVASQLDERCGNISKFVEFPVSENGPVVWKCHGIVD